MRLVDRHLFREWMTAFTLVLSVIIGLLVLQGMYDSLPDLLDIDARPRDIALFYGLKMPTYLPTVMPIGLLVSVLFSLGTLHRNNEITALRASGLSLLRITRVLWAVGLALSGLMLYLNASVVPRCVELSRALYENLEFSFHERTFDSRELGVINNLGFHNQRDNRMWFMNRFSERAWLAMGLTVHSLDDEGRELARISAREAYFDDLSGHWVLKDGRDLAFDPVTGDPLRSLTFEERAFDDYREDPNLMLALHEKPAHLSMFELQRIISTLPADENPSVNSYRVRYYMLLAAPFNCLVVVALAVPFAVAGVRTNPMVGISKCIGWFFLYYVLVSAGTVLGERRMVPVWLAAWAPNLAMLLLAAVFFRRAR